jgi:acyl-CoA reductase-like NAD-dependent aldehyde dehydrogenase
MNVQLLIDNADCDAAGRRRFERRNPVTGEVATSAAAASVADANMAVEAAARAFPAWSAVAPTARRMLLLKAADAMQARSDAFAALMTAETGATAPWAHFNVMLAANMLREAAAMTTQVSGDVIPSDKPGTLALAVRKPAGVCVGIAPWNAPVILATRAIAMPLACGNTVVLKTSEMCPGTQSLIGEVFRDAGFAAGVVNVISNQPQDAAAVVEALIAHPATRRINFTGSTRVGRIIAETAGRHLKPVLLELGGKAPLIVLEDADLDHAVDAAIFGAFANQGQICMSTERIIVVESVADAFVAKFAARAKKLPSGDPRGHVVLGSLVTVEAAEKVEALVADARSKGAVVAAGGGRNGSVMEATVVDRVTETMRIYREESFGPAKSVIRVKDADEAVRVANDTEYGLSAAVFSRDINRALDIAGRIETGICHINGPTVHDEAQMPFGGVKGSGMGRFGGKAGIHEFTKLRWIAVQTSPRHYPF